jgi:hypothetical protein
MLYRLFLQKDKPVEMVSVAISVRFTSFLSYNAWTINKKSIMWFQASAQIISVNQYDATPSGYEHYMCAHVSTKPLGVMWKSLNVKLLQARLACWRIRMTHVTHTTTTSRECVSLLYIDIYVCVPTDGKY